MLGTNHFMLIAELLPVFTLARVSAPNEICNLLTYYSF